MEERRIPKKVLYIYIYIYIYMNLETKRLRGRPRNRWQDEVWEDGRLVGGKCGRKGYIRERNGRSFENGKESSHSAHGNGMNEMNLYTFIH